ncbi:hypothetical protein CLV91_3186 [Maribacter vaceletii]|uniref:Peptidase E n=1 Tax=Maribacter vaceletii TaxID=1206816 RepID=A0A495DS78_9FLAO|nr:DUF6702 family protein [Maribacter vaceletii]RKR06958.1 hypothetical protein CLV91_3186 [Maribacter vaceletii]
MYKKVLLLCILPLFAFTMVHKYYISVTNVTYSEKDQAIQIISRVFVDDMELLLKERYDLQANLATDKESDAAEKYVEKYFNLKFAVTINGEKASCKFLGKKYEDDLMLCYIEIPNVNNKELQSIAIQNEVLIDLYEEQQNIVHVKINDDKKTVILTRENNKGMLNF